MKIKCSKCGFEDEGNFCSNCGAPLVKEIISDDNIDKAVWSEKCPVCRKGILITFKKKKFLGESIRYRCNNCKAEFEPNGEYYKLIYTEGIDNSFKDEYGNEILTSEEWNTIAKGGFSNEKQKEVDYENWLTELSNGNITLYKDKESPVILKRNETLTLALDNISLLEPRSVRTGTYGGPSFRVAKGISIRMGGFKAESHEELKNIDSGMFVITNKKIVLMGTKRTVNIDLRKIISIEPFADGVSIGTEGRQKTQYFSGINNHSLPVKIEGRSYNENLNGIIIKMMIEGLIRNIE